MRRFWHDNRGISSVEFAIVAVVFLMFLFGIVDFGRAMWEWNSAAKATHWGVRYAVVHNMVAPGLFTYDGVGAAGGNGIPIPAGAINPNPVVCTSAGCNGYGPLDTTAFNAIVTQMQQIYSRVLAENVVVEYLHVPGLGFAGNPYGPDFVPIVTVKLQGMVFDWSTPGLFGFASLTMPPFAASMPGEDLAN
jgi:Flp pilus assembly protein TadG